MAKKKQSKKHKFKYSEPTSALRSNDSVEMGSVSQSKLSATLERPNSAGKPMATNGRDFSYVLGDLRRIGILGSSLVLAEVLLWYLFGHTGLGSTIYSLVKV